MRKTKIVCTLGPSSSNEETIRKMLLSGMNVARVNFSHGTHEQHHKTIETFRKVRDELDMPAAVMLDTKGPEIRLKDFVNGKEFLEDGQEFTLTSRDVEGTSSIVATTYERLPNMVKEGDKILIDDGMIVLTVISKTETDILTKVVHGGNVSNHKGVNIPDVDLGMEYIGEQDRSDILFGIEEDVDYIAASFVRMQEDVEELRKLLNDNGGKDIKIIAKIESTQGVDNFAHILPKVDGIMIARGDMGVELAFERLPGIQKRIIKRCLESGKIAITATQMLESMVENPVPTRAEITDVANAVYDGTSAVMLSGETAAGKYPVEAVEVMAKVAEQAEADNETNYHEDRVWHEMNKRDVTNAVAHAACTLAEDINAAGIMAATNSGFTASRMSKFRPAKMIIGATPYTKAYHQMAMMWGVVPIKAKYNAEVEELFDWFASEAVRSGLVEEGSKLVVTAGLPVEKGSKSNMVRVIAAHQDYK